MLTKIGQKFTDLFIKYMPSAYVFALLLTLVAAIMALIWTESSFMQVISGWYNGFWDLLAFGMQIVLIIITAFSIAQSSAVSKGIDYLANYIKTPMQVYFAVCFIGALLSIISFGMLVLVGIFARELALRIKGVHYPYLIACVYFSMGGWVTGFSSSIALLLNTQDNFLIKAGVLSEVIPTTYTLGSYLNLAMVLLFVVVSPILFLFLAPKNNIKELNTMLASNELKKETTVEQEANSYKLPYKAVSDILNNSTLLQFAIALMGLIYIFHHFITKGFDLNFNIMIFIFIIIGLFLHKTPMRYSISMKRASRNISGILFQYPFYAGIMGIMLATGLGDKIGQLLASVATLDSYPFFAFLSGGLVNFAIPSAGGEFAVIGPSIIKVVQGLSEGLPHAEVNAMIARASMSIAYGESLSNALQPFYLLIVFPVMGAGIKIQARDIMGYLVIPFLIYFIIQSILVVWMPI